MPDADLIDIFQRLAMALGIGFLVGVERGWKHRDAPDGARAAGLRTHAVIGLTGGVAGALLPFVGGLGFATISVAVSAALIAFKLRESERDDDVSVTGTIAGLLVYALGVYAMVGDLRVAAAVGVTLAGLLAFKDTLHDWLDKLTWKELRSALLILAATAIALPLLPDRPVDPWGAVNPRELWLLTILVAGASFAGYVAVRLLGGGVGVLAGATVGAVVSSTVVTAELGRRAKAGDTSMAVAAAGASLAAAVSLTRVGILVSAIAAPVLMHVAPALGAAVSVFAGFAWVLARSDGAKAKGETKLSSPLDLKSVAKFALFLGAVIVVGRLVSDAYGEAGLLPFAAAAGIADVDAATLAAASLVRSGLSPEAGAHAILVAALVNTFAKGVIGFVTGGPRYAGLYLAAAALAATVAAAAWLFAEPLIEPILGVEASLPTRAIG
ncbi:mgtC family [alpha proteobacterium U9-1i]|nr:mgtC family [alpha proteobacterium U9-1i]